MVQECRQRAIRKDFRLVDDCFRWPQASRRTLQNQTTHLAGNEGKMWNSGKLTSGSASSTLLAKWPNDAYFQPNFWNSTPQLTKTKSKHEIIKLTSDPIYPCPRDTKNFLGIAKFGHLMTFSHKNNVNRSIIGKNTSFGTNAGYLNFTRLDPTTWLHKLTNLNQF